MNRRAWTRWLVIWLLWTALALFFATQAALIFRYRQQPAPWGLIIRLSLSEWYIWAAFTPLILWLARKFPLEHGRWLRSLLVHLPAGIIFTLLKIAVENEIQRRLLGLQGPSNSAGKLHIAFLTYWAIVGVALAYDYYRRYREHELASARLEKQLAQAQVQALQMQLHPHFLFNTMHAISALMHRDVEAAERMLTRLSDLLRLTLDRADRQEVTLREEMEFIDRYLEIQQIRFQDRLAVKTHVPVEALDALVPNLLLQPLVENAIRHGIAPRHGPGTIEIRAAVVDSRLHLEVRDDGPGLPRAGELREGLGLSNTRARLAQLYGPSHRFELLGGEPQGLRVRIEVPARNGS